MAASAMIAASVPNIAQANSDHVNHLEKIHFYVKRQHLWAYWSYGTRITYHHRAERTQSRAFRKWIQHEWRLRANRSYDYYMQLSALTSDWLCIHNGEGAWDSNTGNGYYGGLQMDITFQLGYNPRAYANYGTANNWPVRDQIVAANRAKVGRGYAPWPNTARACGLL